MKYGISNALQLLAPGAEWVIHGEEYSGLEWLVGNGHDKPSEAVINAKIAELDGAEAMRLLRQERNSLIAESDWMANSDVTMSDAWRTYRQALRDLPASATPTLDSNYKLDMTSVTWPTPPS